MTAGEAQAMRTRTRNRAISRLIENHRAGFDALVAAERSHAEAWQQRHHRPAIPLEDLQQLRQTILTARRRTDGDVA
jgi:hypothetical protein